jgi:hypothetical protein
MPATGGTMNAGCSQRKSKHISNLMQIVTVYDPDSKTRESIPVAELSPNMIKGRLPDGSIVWVDGRKAKPNTKPVHPPFDKSRRRVLRQLKKDLGDVWPDTLAQWEQDLRCEADPDREIRIWQWVAYQYKCLTSTKEASQAQKKDYFRLLLGWTFCKNVDEVLATGDLRGLTPDEAKQVLQGLIVTPLEFFGGRLAKWFPAAPVVDLGAIHSLDEFKRLAAPASVIFAVDWQSGDKWELVFGSELLQSILSSRQAEQLSTAIFAIDFASNQRERLWAMVNVTKGGDDVGPPNSP